MLGIIYRNTHLSKEKNRNEVETRTKQTAAPRSKGMELNYASAPDLMKRWSHRSLSASRLVLIGLVLLFDSTSEVRVFPFRESFNSEGLQFYSDLLF